MGIFAEGIHHHQRHRTLVNHRAHNQAVAGSVGEAGFGQLNVPVIAIHQMVGVAERQAVGRMGEGGGLFFGGAQLADQRILLAGDQQFGQIAGGGDVMHRQAGGLHVAGMGHAERLGFGVHRANKSVVAARIVMRQAGGRAVLGRHQRQQQHIAATNLAVEAHAGVDPLHFRRMADIHRQHLIQRQMGIEHHHSGHHFGDRRHRAHQIRLAGINDFFRGQIDDHGAAGGNFRLRGGHRRRGFC